MYLTDGTFVNAEMVRQGYGHAYTQFPFKYLEEFREFEREAREQKRGALARANRVVKNSAALTSDTPSLVDVVAFEWTDTRELPLPTSVIHDNVIAFDDFSGTAEQIVLTPDTLDAYNSISRNLGDKVDNRGGLPPSVFK